MLRLDPRQWLSRLSRGDERTRVEPSLRLAPPSSVANDGGIDLKPVEVLLAPHAAVLDRIKLAYGSSNEKFERDILSVVSKYARYVHELPATPGNFFCEPGGLLRMGLEVGFMSLQGSDGVIFNSNATVAERMRVDPLWRYATFLAGLLSELHRAFSWMKVTTGAEGVEWPAYRGPLVDWCEEHEVTRYFLRWAPRKPLDARGQALFGVPHIISSELMDHLDVGTGSIVPHMLGCISGIPSHAENKIDLVVRRAAAAVIERYLVGSAERYGKPMVGTHIERYLIDGMQRLVTAGTWLVNAPKSRLWYGRDGLYLVWPGAAADLVKLLEKDQLHGLPKAPNVIAQTLLDAEAFAPASEQNALYWIRPPDASDVLQAVRIANPLMLLASLQPPPQPLASALAVDASRGVVQPPPTSNGPAAAPAATPAPSIELSLPFEESDDDGTVEAEVPQVVERGDDGPPPPAAARPRGLADLPDLSPEIRTVLAAVVLTLGAPTCTARMDGELLVVPLPEFKQRGVDETRAIRAFNEAGVLVIQGRSKTRQVDVDGTPCLAIVLRGVLARQSDAVEG